MADENKNVIKIQTSSDTELDNSLDLQMIGFKNDSNPQLGYKRDPDGQMFYFTPDGGNATFNSVTIDTLAGATPLNVGVDETGKLITMGDAVGGGEVIKEQNGYKLKDLDSGFKNIGSNSVDFSISDYLIYNGVYNGPAGINSFMIGHNNVEEGQFTMGNNIIGGHQNYCYVKDSSMTGYGNKVGNNVYVYDDSGNENLSGMEAYLGSNSVEGQINIAYAYGSHAEGSNNIAGIYIPTYDENGDEITDPDKYRELLNEMFYTEVYDYSYQTTNRFYYVQNIDFDEYKTWYGGPYGSMAHVEGENNAALAYACHVEGYQNVSDIWAAGSHTEGEYNNNAANVAHAEGGENKIYYLASFSHVEGFGNSIGDNLMNMKGNYSHVEGSYNTELGSHSHIEGENNKNLYATYIHLEGRHNTSLGSGSWDEGCGNGAVIHIEGYGNIHYAMGTNSHIEGYNNYTVWSHTHAEGEANQNMAVSAHVEGAHNIVGASKPNDLSFDETDDTTWCWSDNYAGYGAHTEGDNNIAATSKSHAEGFLNIAGWFEQRTTTDGRTYPFTEFGLEAAHAEGISVWAKTHASHAEGLGTIAGTENQITVGYKQKGYTYDPTDLATASLDQDLYGLTFQGIAAHAEGINTRAYGDASHSEGYMCEAIGDVSHAEGFSCKAHGMSSHAQGNGSEAYGSVSHAEGMFGRAYDLGAHAENSIAYAANSHAEGIMTFMGENCHGFGASTYSDIFYTLTKINDTTVEITYTGPANVKDFFDGTEDFANGFGLIDNNNFPSQYFYVNSTDIVSSTWDNTNQKYTIVFTDDTIMTEHPGWNGIISVSNKGTGNMVGGLVNHGYGWYNATLGYGNYNNSDNSFVCGKFNVIKNPDEYIFNVGIGIDETTRADGFIISPSGVLTAPSMEITDITNESTGKVLITREYIENNAGELVKGNEGSGVGYWIKSNNRNNKVKTGTVDLSAAPTINSGVIQQQFGDYSLIAGFDQATTGNYSFNAGYKNIVGDYSGAIGESNEVGKHAFACGRYNDVLGNESFAAGYHNVVNNANGAAVGHFNNDSETDAIFQVGIGIASNARKDGFRVNSSGQVYADEMTTSLIDNDSNNRILITKEYADSNYTPIINANINSTIYNVNIDSNGNPVSKWENGGTYKYEFNVPGATNDMNVCVNLGADLYDEVWNNNLDVAINAEVRSNTVRVMIRILDLELNEINISSNHKLDIKFIK